MNSAPHGSPDLYNGLSRSEMREVLRGKSEKLSDYLEASIDRLHRVYASMILLREFLEGPSLDIGAGHGMCYPVVKHYFPKLLPYSVAEITAKNVKRDGDELECLQFHCEKDRLQKEDRSFGCVMLLDVLEHLLVDPMWTLFEVNRVLRENGFFIISTPNATSVNRVRAIFRGINPGTEIFYKPNAIHQRHNREWSVFEIQTALERAGFGGFQFTTHPHTLSEADRETLRIGKENGLCELDEKLFGEEIFFCAQKIKHLTLDMELDPETRWPSFLYTHSPEYRKRPEVFPIVGIK